MSFWLGIAMSALGGSSIYLAATTSSGRVCAAVAGADIFLAVLCLLNAREGR